MFRHSNERHFNFNLRVLLAIALCTFVTACSTSEETDSQPTTDDVATSSPMSPTAMNNDNANSDAPNLPNSYFNYANIELPLHLRVNAFSNNTPGQFAAVELDNTPANNPITDAGATLGRVLFYDEKLSANGTKSCASCHSQSHGFSDPRVLSEGFDGGDTRRHSMGIANARFYESGKFFWDERAESLEAQVLMPFQDPVEMGLTLTQLEQIVADQSYYPELFNDAFGSSEISSARIADALAQFIRSLVSTQSRYDVARADVTSPLVDFPAFTAQENRGKALFYEPQRLSNGNQFSCSGCHVSEAFVGAVPGNAMNRTSNATNNGLDSRSDDDLGVFESTGNNADVGKFKTPSLVNIAVRPPYMHDGRFRSLEEVIDHYSGGIESHPNLSPPLRDGNRAAQFRFNNQERADLEAFLETLTDFEMLTAEKYSNPFN